jgi:hypothetical protein
MGVGGEFEADHLVLKRVEVNECNPEDDSSSMSKHVSLTKVNEYICALSDK